MDLTLFGVASILGSGGFNLIGTSVREGGALWPLALGISFALLMGSAFTYARAYERFRQNTAETDMVRSVFGSSLENAGIASILVYNIANIAVILVVCTKLLMPSSSVAVTLLMLAGMAGVSLLGIDVNKEIVNVVTGGLLLIFCAASLIGGAGVLTQSSQSLPTPSRAGFLNSVWMFVFVLIGFDALVKFAEEAKNESDIPTSFYLSNVISAILTAGAALAISVWLPGLTEAQSNVAIPLLFAKFLGPWIVGPMEMAISAFMLITTFVVFLATTRYLYGLGEKSEALASVNTAKAPWVAIATVFGAGSALVLLNNTGLLVKITDIGFAVIASLVAGAIAVADWRDGKIAEACVSGATASGFLGLIASAFL
jgi:hypothetical protein